MCLSSLKTIIIEAEMISHKVFRLRVYPVKINNLKEYMCPLIMLTMYAPVFFGLISGKLDWITH